MGLAKGCSSCPAEISLGNKIPRESSSCLFLWAVSLVLSCSKIRSHPPLKTVLKLATPALCLFQSLEKFQHNQLGYSIQDNSLPFLQVSALSLKSSRTLLHLGINLRSIQHQPCLYNKAMESRNPNSLDVVTEWHTQQLLYLINTAELFKASRLSWNYAHELSY